MLKQETTTEANTQNETNVTIERYKQTDKELD